MLTLLARVFLVNYIKRKVKQIMFQRIKAKLMTSGKGMLTYSSVLAIVLPVLSNALGVSLVEADVLPIYQGVLALVAIFGRWRAAR